MLQQSGMTVWFTGLSGAGKTKISSPQMVLLSFERDNHLKKMPLIRNIRTFATHFKCVLLSEFHSTILGATYR